MKPNVGSSKTLIKVNKTLANLIIGRREKTQINKIAYEKGDITRKTNETQRTIREYLENLYPRKS
jgi:hypothetical protein